MHVPVPKYSASLEGTVVVPFKCRQCGHETSAAVRSRGDGQAGTHPIVDGYGSMEQARANATHLMKLHAAALAALARCPACRNVDAAAISRARNWALAKAASIVAATVGLSTLYAVGENAPWSMPATFGAGALLVTVILYRRDRWRWAEAEQRVKFLSGAELAALQLVSESPAGEASGPVTDQPPSPPPGPR